MNDMVAETAVSAEGPVLARLSRLDRFLPVWIIVAMALGLALGRWVPGLDDALSAVEVGNVSLPITIGLLLMMYPVLAKVRYSELDRVTETFTAADSAGPRRHRHRAGGGRCRRPGSSTA